MPSASLRDEAIVVVQPTEDWVGHEVAHVRSGLGFSLMSPDRLCAGGTCVPLGRNAKTFPSNPKTFKSPRLMRVKGSDGKYTWREYKGLDSQG